MPTSLVQDPSHRDLLSRLQQAEEAVRARDDFLAIAALAAQQGSIEGAQGPGGGAVFRVYLPLHTAKPQTPKDEQT